LCYMQHMPYMDSTMFGEGFSKCHHTWAMMLA